MNTVCCNPNTLQCGNAKVQKSKVPLALSMPKLHTVPQAMASDPPAKRPGCAMVFLLSGRRKQTVQWCQMLNTDMPTAWQKRSILSRNHLSVRYYIQSWILNRLSDYTASSMRSEWRAG